jgi:molybdopterin/thiamine biosynthesis adenylyltransferase
VRQSKPLVECAVYEMEGQITSILPGNTPCLSCLYPEDPPVWKRQFPIFGAVAGVLGCLAATEAIKLLSGLGEPLVGQLLTCDLADMTFRRRRIERSPQCAVCGEAKLQA